MDRRTFIALSSAAALSGCLSNTGGGPQEPSYVPLETTPGSVLSNPATMANVGSALDRLTAQFSNASLWSKNGRWTKKGRDLFAYMSTSWAEGLQPTTYLPDSFNRGLGRATPERDRALSAGALKLASDISNGRTRPDFVGAVSKVAQIRAAGDVTGALGNLSPSKGPYRQLRNAALKALRGKGVQAGGFNSLETTMEKLRLRAFPDISGQVIVVNIAAYDLHAYNDGRPYLRSRVIVGKEGRQTPTGRDYITNLKFSPDWTPPRSIINADLVPALQEDPTSLDPLNMTIRVNGKRVNPHTYNWASVNPNAVTMHQPPGPNAILGGVRFSLNNSRAIYLHDTSAKPLFNNNLRTASSGCVRVERSRELATWLLARDGQPVGEAELTRLMNLDDPKFVSLRQRVRVETLYYTAWINDQGVFTLYPDIYERDGSLVSRLKRG